jgi:hypothetical protein
MSKSAPPPTIERRVSSFTAYLDASQKPQTQSSRPGWIRRLSSALSSTTDIDLDAEKEKRKLNSTIDRRPSWSNNGGMKSSPAKEPTALLPGETAPRDPPLRMSKKKVQPVQTKRDVDPETPELSSGGEEGQIGFGATINRADSTVAAPSTSRAPSNPPTSPPAELEGRRRSSIFSSFGRSNSRSSAASPPPPSDRLSRRISNLSSSSNSNQRDRFVHEGGNSACQLPVPPSLRRSSTAPNNANVPTSSPTAPGDHAAQAEADRAARAERHRIKQRERKETELREAEERKMVIKREMEGAEHGTDWVEAEEERRIQEWMAREQRRPSRAPDYGADVRA